MISTSSTNTLGINIRGISSLYANIIKTNISFYSSANIRSTHCMCTSEISYFNTSLFSTSNLAISTFSISSFDINIFVRKKLSISIFCISISINSTSNTSCSDISTVKLRIANLSTRSTFIFSQK